VPLLPYSEHKSSVFPSFKESPQFFAFHPSPRAFQPGRFFLSFFPTFKVNLLTPFTVRTPLPAERGEHKLLERSLPESATTSGCLCLSCLSFFCSFGARFGIASLFAPVRLLWTFFRKNPCSKFTLLRISPAKRILWTTPPVSAPTALGALSSPTFLLPR